MFVSMSVSKFMSRSRSISISMSMYPGPVLPLIAPDNTTKHVDDTEVHAV